MDRDSQLARAIETGIAFFARAQLESGEVPMGSADMTGHLIHIGYAKTGSNFLRNWFTQHPQLAFAPGGIAGLQDVYGMVREAASLRGRPLYRVTSSEGLATPSPSSGRIDVDYQEILPISMPRVQAEACELLGTLFPNARILIVTRGFRSMLMSAYSQFVRSGGEVPLAQACAEAKKETKMLAQWNYDFLIDLYRKEFGYSNVIVLPYELMRDDAAAFLGEIARRLGLDEVGAPPGRPNPTLSPIELAWYPWLARRVRSLPLGRSGRRRARQFYLQAAMSNRLRWPIALLQRIRPLPPVTDAPLTPELMQEFRGFASSLREEPLYRAYARDYLFD